MSKNALVIAGVAFTCFLIGLFLYRLQATQPEPMMNLWGVVSFASIGACLGCLMIEPTDLFDRWW